PSPLASLAARAGGPLPGVPGVRALTPTFTRGRLRGKEENGIVRGFMSVYKPLLSWALPHRNLVMWAFSALLILAGGLFPLQAFLGYGASQVAWEYCFLALLALVTFVTVIFTRGFHWQGLSLW